jgi:DNA-binding transcriptional LysR family regulator
MTAELRHLRALVAIADEGTVTRAAARLHLTQPALSRTLAQLEAHLGVRLVERSTHHLELTAAGRLFHHRARAALAAVDEVLDPARAATWPLRLGHAWSGLGPHTTALLRKWSDAHPEVPLELLRIDDRAAGLTQGKVDAAVLREPISLPNVRTSWLFAETRLAAVPSDSPLAERPILTLTDLTAYPIALNTVSGTTTVDLWPEGARPHTTVEVANTDDWLAAIAAGRAVGVTTSATADMHPHTAVTYRPLPGVPHVDVYLAWREPPTHPAVAELLDVITVIVRASRVRADAAFGEARA